MNLSRQLKDIIPQSLLPLVPNRFQVIGDVAVISIPPALDGYGTAIAEHLIRHRHNIKTVLNKVAMVAGQERVGTFQVLLGGSTGTVHRENGYSYQLDVAKVFFNPRLSYERCRVASLVKPLEHVLVPFGGVGPFVVPAAARGARVVAIEKNGPACAYLAGNVRANHVQGNVSIIHGDACYVDGMLNADFDRVIVPTPYGMDQILMVLLPLVKPGGMVHFYTFLKQHQLPGLLEEYQSYGFEVVFHRRCGNVAPAVSRWVFDLKKQ